MTISTNDDHLASLAAQLADELGRQSLTLATAESCTGGGISWLLTGIPGSSAWFERGFVVYSNPAKKDMLGVHDKTLAAHGAVSEQVALEMASGALTHSKADVSMAVTGIAGPDGGTDTKPVGTVCFGWQKRGHKGVSSRFHFQGDRAAVRVMAIGMALQGALDLLARG